MWKTKVGIVILVLGFLFMIIPAWVISAIIVNAATGGAANQKFWVACYILTGFLTIILTLIGSPIQKGSTAGKIFYMILTGILPAYIVMKGWDAITEGKNRQGVIDGSSPSDVRLATQATAVPIRFLLWTLTIVFLGAGMCLLGFGIVIATSDPYAFKQFGDGIEYLLWGVWLIILGFVSLRMATHSRRDPSSTSTTFQATKPDLNGKTKKVTSSDANSEG